MRTSVQHFAELGNPLATSDDWNREVALAQNPNAATRAREQALAYVRPAAPYERPKRLAPRDYPVTNPERIAQMQTVRENLKLTLRALQQHKPAPIMAEARKPAPSLVRPEPGSAPVPKTKVKTKRERQADHRRFVREQRFELMARDLGMSVGELKEKLGCA